MFLTTMAQWYLYCVKAKMQNSSKQCRTSTVIPSPAGLTRSTNIFGNMNIPDRENHKDHIYANVDDVNSHKVSRRTEDTKKKQTSQHTGSECVRIRRYRSVLVCLVVLCVLLLTAVIVLCVLIYTNNHQCHITEERDQLRTNNTKITEEKDQLLTKNTKLTDEREELQSMIDGLNKQVEQLNQEKTNFLKCSHERDGWKLFGLRLYYISSELKTWTESRSYCTERGADLIIINNKQKRDCIKNIYGKEEIWIGLSDSEKENTWKWVDGSTMTTGSWGPTEPNGQRTENCIMSQESVWYDYACDSKFKWICEKICL